MIRWARRALYAVALAIGALNVLWCGGVFDRSGIVDELPPDDPYFHLAQNAPAGTRITFLPSGHYTVNIVERGSLAAVALFCALLVAIVWVARSPRQEQDVTASQTWIFFLAANALLLFVARTKG